MIKGKNNRIAGLKVKINNLRKKILPVSVKSKTFSKDLENNRNVEVDIYINQKKIDNLKNGKSELGDRILTSKATTE